MAEIGRVGPAVGVPLPVVKHFTMERLIVGDRVVVDQKTGDIRRMRDGDDWYATALHTADVGTLVTLLQDGTQTYAPNAGTDRNEDDDGR